MSRNSWYATPPRKPYQRSPERAAKLWEAREIALEKLKADASLIYDLIYKECEQLSLRAASDPTLAFFCREGRWWLRIQVVQLANQLPGLCYAHLQAALRWLIKEGYINQDNFDKDYCKVKWYSCNDKGAL